MNLFNENVVNNLNKWKQACDRGVTLQERMLLLKRLDNSLVVLIKHTNDLVNTYS